MYYINSNIYIILASLTTFRKTSSFTFQILYCSSSFYSLKNSTIILSNYEYKKETTAILSSLPIFSLLSLFIQCLSIVLFQIGHTKYSIFHTFAFPITASSKVHIYYHFNYSNLSIHSHYYFLSSRQKSPKSKNVKFHFILPMASFDRKYLHSNGCFP